MNQLSFKNATIVAGLILLFVAGAASAFAEANNDCNKNINASYTVGTRTFTPAQLAPTVNYFFSAVLSISPGESNDFLKKLFGKSPEKIMFMDFVVQNSGCFGQKDIVINQIKISKNHSERLRVSVPYILQDRKSVGYGYWNSSTSSTSCIKYNVPQLVVAGKELHIIIFVNVEGSNPGDTVQIKLNSINYTIDPSGRQLNNFQESKYDVQGQGLIPIN